MLLGALQNVYVKIYGPSPGVSNLPVALRVGYGVLKPELAPQRLQQTGMDTLDATVTAQSAK